MKTTALITALTLVLIGTAVGQTISPTDKVLFDRATAFVKGLRDGKSWNKTIAELKKDFPDMKELEPFRAIEGSEIFAREFGALYSFDTAIMPKIVGWRCKNFPQLQLSFYQDKLYRAEIYYYAERGELTSKIATSFFSKTETEGRYGGPGAVTVFRETNRYGNVRVVPTIFNGRAKYSCEFIPQSQQIMEKLNKFIFTEINIEKQFYADQNLLHPDWGYVNVTWNSNLQDVSAAYKNLVEKSDDNKIYGLRKFVQENKSGGDIVSRTFMFFQDSLFGVTVKYKGRGMEIPPCDKIDLIYRENFRRGSCGDGYIEYSNPLRHYRMIISIIDQVEMKQAEERKKQKIAGADL